MKTRHFGPGQLESTELVRNHDGTVNIRGTHTVYCRYGFDHEVHVNLPILPIDGYPNPFAVSEETIIDWIGWYLDEEWEDPCDDFTVLETIERIVSSEDFISEDVTDTAVEIIKALIEIGVLDENTPH